MGWGKRWEVGWGKSYITQKGGLRREEALPGGGRPTPEGGLAVSCVGLQEPCPVWASLIWVELVSSLPG